MVTLIKLDKEITGYTRNDVSMILWTPFGRILSNQRSCPNVTKIYQRIQRIFSEQENEIEYPKFRVDKTFEENSYLNEATIKRIS